MQIDIKNAKRGFEAAFSEKAFYDRQTKDETHLEAILNTLEIKPGDKILDFGTGSGYLAFEIAKKHRQCSVVGLDIVSDALERNRIFASEHGIDNIKFVDYDGVSLPFESNTFDWVVTRYALHHVSDIRRMFDEISRVLKSGGSFFLSDPTPNRLDTDRFVDSYMKLQNDGHHKFYTLNEFSRFAADSKMELKDYFLSAIRFPRKINESYLDLLGNTDENIKQAYKIEISKDECFIVEDVLNVLFRA